VVAFWVSGILYVTLLLAGVFFVNIYSEDKVSSAYELELANNAQLASFIEKIILSAPLLTLEQMKNSSQIVFSKNAPCSTGTVSAAASIAAGQSAVSTAVVVSSVF
jgi:homoserine kinase